MPNHRRRIAKPRPMNPKGRKKKKPKVELVLKCDYCGKPLDRTCARTIGSVVCAGGVGIKTYVDGGSLSFFCSAECRADHVTDRAYM